MSIRVMTEVWEHSEQGGSALLLLLAIADYSNDEGVAWPKIQTLANKTRLSTRQVMRLIQEMETAGELKVDRTDKSNRYKVTLASGDKLSRDMGVTHIGDICVTSNKPSVEPSTTTGTVIDSSYLPIGHKEDEKKSKFSDEELGKVFSFWADNVPGTLTEVLKEKLDGLIEETSPTSVIHGIDVALENNARNFKYISACARNHAAGKTFDEPSGKSSGSKGKRDTSVKWDDGVLEGFENVINS